MRPLCAKKPFTSIYDTTRATRCLPSSSSRRCSPSLVHIFATQMCLLEVPIVEWLECKHRQTQPPINVNPCCTLDASRLSSGTSLSPGTLVYACPLPGPPCVNPWYYSKVFTVPGFCMTCTRLFVWRLRSIGIPLPHEVGSILKS